MMDEDNQNSKKNGGCLAIATGLLGLTYFGSAAWINPVPQLITIALMGVFCVAGGIVIIWQETSKEMQSEKRKRKQKNELSLPQDFNDNQ